MIERNVRRDAGVGSEAVTNGSRVHVSLGKRIGRVSSGWFSRPDDERYLSLDALCDAVRSRPERVTARTVETKALRVEARTNDVSRLALALPGRDESHFPARLLASTTMPRPPRAGRVARATPPVRRYGAARPARRGWWRGA